MKSSAGWIVALVSGLLAMVSPRAFSQAPDGASQLDVSAAYRPAQNAMPVRAALNQFSSALATRDADKLQAAGVKPASVKRWRKFFRENPRATVLDLCPASELNVSVDTATWTCTETVTIIFDGKPLSFPHVIHFTFARNNGTWLVADRR